MVILPQTVERNLPDGMNLCAVLTIARPLVSIVGVDDIMGHARAALSAEGRPEVHLCVLSWFFAWRLPRWPGSW